MKWHDYCLILSSSIDSIDGIFEVVSSNGIDGNFVFVLNFEFFFHPLLFFYYYVIYDMCMVYYDVYLVYVLADLSSFVGSTVKNVCCKCNSSYSNSCISRYY